MNITEKGTELQPYEGTLDDVNERRHAIGLAPIDDYLEKINDLYKGKSP